MKKTLLIAAAALVAGVISSEAQVYSVNIVGYANVVMSNGVFNAVANPFDLDGVNNITNVLSNFTKGGGGSIQLWSPTSGFGGAGNIITRNGAGTWSATAATTFVPPGVGMMIKPGGAAGSGTYTNTFVGNVIVPSGGTNLLNLSKSVNLFVGSPVPYSGDLSSAGNNGLYTLNLGASMPSGGGSSIQTFGPAGFSLASKNAAGVWSANPTISVGQAFMVNAGTKGPTNWVQTLQ